MNHRGHVRPSRALPAWDSDLGRGHCLAGIGGHAAFRLAVAFLRPSLLLLGLLAEQKEQQQQQHLATIILQVFGVAMDSPPCAPYTLCACVCACCVCASRCARLFEFIICV